MTTKKTSNNTEQKKRLFIEALQASMGNITKACKSINIDRGSYYGWIKEDPEFKKEVEHCDEYIIDNVESALFKQIKEGNTTATIFYLKTKAKHRGYVERIENTGKDGSDLIPKPKVLTKEQFREYIKDVESEY